MARNSETQCLHGGNSKPKREKGGGLSQIHIHLPRPDRQLRDVQPDGAKSQGQPALKSVCGGGGEPKVIFIRGWDHKYEIDSEETI